MSILTNIINKLTPNIMTKKKDKSYSVVKAEDGTILYRHTSQLEKKDKVLHSTDDLNEAIQKCNKENGAPDHGKKKEEESKDEKSEDDSEEKS